jgi:CheY-like chemotaxis protein
MHNGKILIVDDDPMIRTIMEEMLGDTYELTMAASGVEALESAEKFRPHLILMDMRMPGIDGCETCRQMRERESLRPAKIVLVSGEIVESERLRGLASGADDYITKPFDFAGLLAKVADLLGQVPKE